MTFEREYYEFERFWNNPDYSYKINIEKIQITFDYLQSDVTSLLDAACGNGIFTNMALERFPDMEIMAFDRSEAALKYVKGRKIIAGIDEIPFPDYTFDAVVAHDVIEHLPVDVYSKAIQELSRVAKKYIIVAVPYMENLQDNISECPSCKTIFNNDLHLRSFDKSSIKDLFLQYGFLCTNIETCERNTYWVGQKLYSNLFYPKWKKYFRSPICPICGYKNSLDQDLSFKIGEKEQNAQKSFVDYIKSIPKLFWPKYSKDYEMVALFKRK